MKNIKDKNSKGSLLFELLIVISIIAIIFAVSSNAMFLSLKGNKMMGDRDTALSLATEELEAVRSVADEDWMNIYNTTTKGSQHYKLTQSSNKWIIQTGDESVTINGITYTRYFIISNVSRDVSSNIESTYNSSNDDPSTQKVTVTVSWTDGNPITISDYFFRWKNKACSQGGWNTGGVGSGVAYDCTNAIYDTAGSELDITGGTIKLK